MLLSIESSCDDSSIAVTKIDDKKLFFHKKISQEIDHSKYGGVVPELAARLHAKALPKILEECKEYFKDLKAIAVTNEPGLSVTLVEGVTMAKALCIALDAPLVGVNHLKGHIASLFIEKEGVFPMITLLVSGGHTQVLFVKSFFEYEVLAETLDDSFGESFDKVAKMLGLGYPGGPVVEEYAKRGDEDRFDFTVPLYNSNRLAFSYSGLKNQVRLAIESIKELNEQDKADICASFQKTAVLHLLHKLKKILKERTKNPHILSVVGGASANGYLRNRLERLSKDFDMELLLAPLEYCSDNAAMIGRYAIEAYKKSLFTDIDKIKISPKVSCAQSFSA
ncbi:MAG: tRNA (adenosine(37)-N6)-threonylcarbamoyltransferase complex transferase subunit TsaD [Epsilonproteobacteria bacterium]|nr:tRNA (adenosine(37)-N6)-threonylcarbamoyltransferase complex transferase subunit TsaD [Campylobacterota bacterium]